MTDLRAWAQAQQPAQRALIDSLCRIPAPSHRERARAEAIPSIEMKELSMGMSHDYELAARHGATMVRIGSALMGARDYGPQGQH